MKLETFALKWAVTEKFRDYLLGGTFTVYTDNNPLTYLNKKAKLAALEQRWAASLAPFNFDIRYRPGHNNANADGLSRLAFHEESYISTDDSAIIWRDTRVVNLLCNVPGSLVVWMMHLCRGVTRKAEQRSLSAGHVQSSCTTHTWVASTCDQRVSSCRRHMKSLTWYTHQVHRHQLQQGTGACPTKHETQSKYAVHTHRVDTLYACGVCKVQMCPASIGTTTCTSTPSVIPAKPVLL